MGPPGRHRPGSLARGHGHLALVRNASRARKSLRLVLQPQPQPNGRWPRCPVSIRNMPAAIRIQGPVVAHVQLGGAPRRSSSTLVMRRPTIVDPGKEAGYGCAASVTVAIADWPSLV